MAAISRCWAFATDATEHVSKNSLAIVAISEFPGRTALNFVRIHPAGPRRREATEIAAPTRELLKGNRAIKPNRVSLRRLGLLISHRSHAVLCCKPPAGKRKFTTHHGGQHLDLAHFLLWDCQVVAIQHNQVREFAGFERAKLFLGTTQAVYSSP